MPIFFSLDLVIVRKQHTWTCYSNYIELHNNEGILNFEEKKQVRNNIYVCGNEVVYFVSTISDILLLQNLKFLAFSI